MSTRAPTAEVLQAFSVDGTAEPLPGGQGVTFRAGAVVLKPVEDAAETSWTQALLTRVLPDGFRVAGPVATKDGRWVHQGWAACRFIPGLRPLAPRWDEVVAAGLRFCDAAEQARGDDVGVLQRRSHRWAVADRVAWEDESLGLAAPTADLLDQITVGFESAARPVQFVHGDLSGNVFVDGDGTPVILDVSPYLRPRNWAAAIVVCDALLWHNADADVVAMLADDVEMDLLLRALAFRLVADELAFNLARDQDVRRRYERVLATLGAIIPRGGGGRTN